MQRELAPEMADILIARRGVVEEVSDHREERADDARDRPDLEDPALTPGVVRHRRHYRLRVHRLPLP
jgi:hypothetical protein